MMTKTTATMFHTLISEVGDIAAYAENQTINDKGDKYLEQYARCKNLVDIVTTLHDQVLLNGKMIASEYRSLLNQVSEIEQLLSNEDRPLRADSSPSKENGNKERHLFATADGGW